MTEPIACRLTPGEQLGRREQAAALMERSLEASEPIEGGFRLRFRPEAERELRELVARERECCPFFSFTFEAGGPGLVLDATAPPEARPLLGELFAAP